MKRASRIAFALVVVFVGLIAAGVAILKTLDFNEYRDLIAEKAQEATGREVVITGDLDLGISLTPTLRVEGVTFANAEWGSRPEMAQIERLEASVELIPLLSGEARINRILLSGLDLLIETDAQGRGNWQFAAKEPASAKDGGTAATGTEADPDADGGLAIEPVVREVVFENVRVTYRDGVAKQSYEVLLTRLTAEAEGNTGPIAFDGNGQFAQTPFRLGGQVGSLAAVLNDERFPFALKGSAFAAEFGLDGVIGNPKQGTGLDLKVSVTAADLPKSVASLAALAPGLAGAAVPPGPAKISGQVRQTETGFALADLQASLGENAISGTATLDLAATRPQVTAEFSASRLDLASLLSASPEPQKAPPVTAAPPVTGKNEPERLFSADPLAFDGLKAVDGTLTFKAGQVVLPNGVRLDKVMVVAVLDRGRLSLSPLRSELAGGSLEGTARLDASGPAAALDLSLNGKGVVVGDILKQIEISDLLLGGATDVDIQLKGRGRSVREIMASLGGDLTVEMGEGRIYNKALDMAGGDALMQVLNALNPGAVQQDYSVLSCAVVRFGVEKGLATAQNGIAAETDKLNIVGAGTINLAEEKLDLAIKPEARGGLGVSVGSLVAGLIHVTGTLAEPSVGLDEKGAAKAAVSIGAALATGGLSVLGEALVGRTTRDPHPCLTALGKAPTPGAEQPAPARQEPAQAPASVEDAGKAAKEMIEGVGKTLQNLFGGKK